MSGLRGVVYLVRADFLERTRRNSSLTVLGLTVLLTYLTLPPLDAGYLAFNLGGTRGVYNAAWVGVTVTVMTVVFMPLPGFYLVKSAIRLDRHTGVGQILATTPLRKVQYTLGKMLSNWIYLAAMAGAAVLAAVGVQLLRGEVLHIAPWDYLAPYLLFTLPMLAFVAALAVLFESIPWLRGSFGNAAFFFVFVGSYWMLAGVAMVVLSPVPEGQSTAIPVPDPTGALAIFRSMILAGKSHIPGYTGGLEYFHARPLEAYGAVRTFVWQGASWTAPLILGRLAWVGIALGLAALAAVPFDRFDPARGKIKPQPAGSAEAATLVSLPSRASPPSPVRLAPLAGARRPSWARLFGRTVLSELRLMLKGVGWWWYGVAGGLAVATYLRPVEGWGHIWLPLAWLWPLALWSPLGNREVRHRTDQIVFSTARPLRVQLPAAWAAGVGVALAAGSGAALRLAADGQWHALLGWGVGAAFIPALALALGVWSRGRKLFEVGYLLLWLAGPVEGWAWVLDYTGTTQPAIANGLPLYYLGLTVVLLGLAAAGRWRQMRA